MIRLFLAIIIPCLFSISLLGQDIHFSQFNRSYLNLNPALVGDFNGSYRLNGNFRNQWSSVSEPFRTFSFSAEAKNPFSQIPGLHLGILFFNDEAGLGGLQTTQANLSLSYSRKLNADSSLVVAFGVQTGLTSRSINFNAFSFDQQFNGIQFDPNSPTGESFERNSFSHFNAHIGLAFNYLIEQRKLIKVGWSAFNLNQANQSFQGSNIPLDSRNTFFVQLDYMLSRKLDLMPSVLSSSQGRYRELVLGSNLRYRLDDNSFLKRNIYGGIWYRNQDAIIASAGLDYNQWQVGISYDINTSGLEVASNNRGGLEISITYIIQTFKPSIRRYKRCPSYI